ncbi:nickel-binding protein [Mycolicibacterium sp. lyk4-40-TYG-92]|uniref:nickel-binding protein n=1 Tax=Mycolicibacterium sp. lyk4-40-TYG-92 TaxID=3040295 RepID=UPI002550AA1B|nr:nickel-binding protein [Mycolicibacterium sp. lyk4-40-TYG-92]
MSLFLSTHQAPGLSEEEIAGYAPEVAKNVHATFKHLYANTDSGAIFTLYEAETADALRQEFERVGFPYDEIHEIDAAVDGAAVAAMANQ